jgi:hypothetical protein
LDAQTDLRNNIETAFQRKNDDGVEQAAVRSRNPNAQRKVNPLQETLG